MNTPDYISTLSKAEQQALAICGISKATQLATCNYAALSADVQRAREFFPEQMAALTDERLQSIILTAGNVVQEELPPPTESPARIPPQPPQLRPKKESSERGGKRSKLSKDGGKDAHIQRLYAKSHSITCSRPLHLYISALLTVLLYLDCIAWLVVPVLLYLDMLPAMNSALVLGVLALPLVLFFIVCPGAGCTICNVRIFTRKGFSTSKYAHKWLFLGTTLSTALHILLFLWYRCPACGTPQSLRRRRRRH